MRQIKGVAIILSICICGALADFLCVYFLGYEPRSSFAVYFFLGYLLSEVMKLKDGSK